MKKISLYKSIAAASLGCVLACGTGVFYAFPRYFRTHGGSIEYRSFFTRRSISTTDFYAWGMICFVLLFFFLILYSISLRLYNAKNTPSTSPVSAELRWVLIGFALVFLGGMIAALKFGYL